MIALREEQGSAKPHKLGPARAVRAPAINFQAQPESIASAVNPGSFRVRGNTPLVRRDSFSTHAAGNRKTPLRVLSDLQLQVDFTLIVAQRCVEEENALYARAVHDSAEPHSGGAKPSNSVGNDQFHFLNWLSCSRLSSISA